MDSHFFRAPAQRRSWRVLPLHGECFATAFRQKPVSAGGNSQRKSWRRELFGIVFYRCRQLYFSRRLALDARTRSEEHTSELQSRFDLVCRLLLEKKKSY